VHTVYNEEDGQNHAEFFSCFWNGDKLVHITRYTKVGSESYTKTDALHFYYDADGKPSHVQLNDTRFFYQYNLQGDVIGILAGHHSQIVRYEYDAWGKVISITGSRKDNLGKYNPFRYRHYMYDDSVSLYYLKSRHYHPALCRFLQADTVLGKLGAIGSHNIYAYCCNSPITYDDPHGKTQRKVVRNKEHENIWNEANVVYNALSNGNRHPLFSPTGTWSLTSVKFKKSPTINNGLEAAIWDIVDFLSVDADSVSNGIGAALFSIIQTGTGCVSSAVGTTLTLLSGIQGINLWERPLTHECFNYRVDVIYKGVGLDNKNNRMVFFYTFSGCTDKTCTQFSGFSCTLWMGIGSDIQIIPIID